MTTPEELLPVLIQNTVDAHWDISRCYCIICVIGRSMGMHPMEVIDRFGKPNVSLRYERPTLEVKMPTTDVADWIGRRPPTRPNPSIGAVQPK